MSDNYAYVIPKICRIMSKNHPRIVAISRLVTRKDNFFFSIKLTYEKTEKLLRNLDTKKASQDTDIPTRIIKDSSYIERLE